MCWLVCFGSVANPFLIILFVVNKTVIRILVKSHLNANDNCYYLRGVLSFHSAHHYEIKDDGSCLSLIPANVFSMLSSL